MAVPALRLALAAALVTACGSRRPADSTSAADREQPADAGVSLGRPSQPAGKGGPELPPTVIRSSVLETHRLTGVPQIEPDAEDRTPPEGQKSVVAAVKICVDTAGKVSAVKFLKSSGRPNYDAKIEREAKSWTFRPIMGEEQPIDVCTVMTFVYRPGTPSASPPAP
jgi:TonB family protein